MLTHPTPHLRQGKVTWEPSQNTDTYYTDDVHVMHEWASLHQRNIDSPGASCTRANARLLYGGVKLAHQADGPPRNAVMLLPPLIIERVERSFKRTVLEVTFNIGVRNHMWSHIKTPPTFNYSLADMPIFMELMTYSLAWMAEKSIKMSNHFGIKGSIEDSEDEDLEHLANRLAESDEDPIYEVEQIEGERKRKGRIEYFISWKGYGSEHSTWEPRANVGKAAVLEWKAFLNDKDLSSAPSPGSGRSD